jgi:hypothetical protein
LRLRSGRETKKARAMATANSPKATPADAANLYRVLRGSTAGRRSGWVALAIYTGVAVVGGLAAVALGYDPFTTPAWMETTGASALLVSAGLGACLAAATVALTRVLVERAVWARELHADLRPVVQGHGDVQVALLALASGIGEEIVFRGIFAQMIGIVLSSLAFGALHQVKGRARWAWMIWATVMGLLFALVFKATGSLAGAMAAHAAINWANLRYLRDKDVQPRKRQYLGGILR